MDESGCGKSTTGKAILGLNPVTSGRIEFEGRDMASLTRAERAVQWRDLQLVFQDPISALNPKRTIGQSIEGTLAIQRVPAADRRAHVAEVLSRVGLNPSQRDRFPNELSGGQRQRVLIARALAYQPKLIVCDKPVSALDVSIQSQILKLQQDLGLAVLLISHDLSVVRHLADRIAVMYVGHVVEIAETQALLSGVPQPDTRAERNRRTILLEGGPSQPHRPAQGLPLRDPLPDPRSPLRHRSPATGTDASRPAGQLLGPCWGLKRKTGAAARRPRFPFVMSPDQKPNEKRRVTPKRSEGWYSS